MLTRYGPVLLIVAILIGGCISANYAPQYGPIERVQIPPQLGVVLDQELRIVDVHAQSAAERAGIRIGDVLIDATWIASPTPDPLATQSPTPTEHIVSIITPDVASDDTASDGVASEAAASLEEIPTPNVVEAEGVILEDYLTTDPVPFSDREKIGLMVFLYAPMKIKLQRGEEVLELEVMPSPPVYHELAPGEGTVTPIPNDFIYY